MAVLLMCVALCITIAFPIMWLWVLCFFFYKLKKALFILCTGISTSPNKPQWKPDFWGRYYIKLYFFVILLWIFMNLWILILAEKRAKHSTVPASQMWKSGCFLCRYSCSEMNTLDDFTLISFKSISIMIFNCSAVVKDDSRLWEVTLIENWTMKLWNVKPIILKNLQTNNFLHISLAHLPMCIPRTI